MTGDPAPRRSPAREGRADPGGVIVVTGAGGFIGSAWCAHARAAGRQVHPWVRTHGEASMLAPSIAFDLESAAHDELVAALAGAYAVVHLAGRAHRPGDRARRVAAGGPSPDAEMRGANVEATARLARAAVDAGVTRLVFASSIKVHGEATSPGRPFRPDDAPAPQDAYARSKADAETALLTAAAGTSMQPVILRLPMVYGRGAKGNFRRLVDAVARGAWLPLASIDNRRSLLSLANLMAALDAALDIPAGAARGTDDRERRADAAPARMPQVHLVADADAVSTPQLVRAIAAALDVRPRLHQCPGALLRLAGAITGRSAAIARLTGSLEADTTSFTAWTGWRPRPFALDRAMVERDPGRVQSAQ